jgi:deoxyribodipyrimidine photo-lyase
LKSLGGQVHVLTGEAVQVLSALHASLHFDALWSHQETGNAATYARDTAVATWCKTARVDWHEYPQFGVVRRLKDRDTWQSKWEAHMAAPQWHALDEGASFAALPDAVLALQRVPTAAELGLDTGQFLNGLACGHPGRQTGGLQRGNAVLVDFLRQRSKGYRGGVSSPLSAPDACSRLSPYFAYGCVSMRQVVQATRRMASQLPDSAHAQRKGLAAFTSRLYWHCHFIQKLESEPELEWRNLHRGYDGLREPEWNPAHFETLTAGRTGWPMVDACVAMLARTGWINFRMRAMLVSVAAYPLWLHWQPVGQWLARQFLDYEPGIHWSQMQMQSGTTGINTTRVYNPVKQAMDHDPQGIFVRRWLPALRKLPDAWLFEPWKLPLNLQAQYGVTVGLDIAVPLVDLDVATRVAKQRVHQLRAQPGVQAAKAVIVQRHGSRGGQSDSVRESALRKPRKAAGGSAQLGLDF